MRYLHRTIFLLSTILVYRIDLAPISRNSACRHIPYDFYNIRGTRDFYFLRYEYLDFSSARQFCVSQGMDLPTILNQDQNNLIHSFIKHSKYQQYHTLGISPLNNINNNMWLNGDNFSFKNFKLNISTNILDMHIRIAADDGHWDLSSCNKPAGVVCHVRC